MVVAGLVMIGVAVAVLARVYINSPRRAQPMPVPPSVTTAEPDDADEPVRHSLRPWVLRGIEVEEAKRWIDRGFDADHAYLLRSMDVDPRTAARLRKAGLEDSALVSLVEEASFRHQTGHDDLVALAERAPHLAPQAVAWMSLGIDADRALAYVAEGFTSGRVGSVARRGMGHGRRAAVVRGEVRAGERQGVAGQRLRSGRSPSVEARALRREAGHRMATAGRHPDTGPRSREAIQ